MGLSHLILASNRYNFDPSVEKSIVTTLGGPAYGYGSQVIRGARDLLQGETQRGIENILPAALRNMVKSGRYFTEGPTTRRGDPIMGDPGLGLVAAQFFGFAPAEYTLNQERNQVLKGIDRAVNEERTLLSRRYYIALRMGDISGAQDVMDSITKFNKKWPQFAIDGEYLQKSLKSHRATSQKMHNGVLFSPALNTTMQMLSDEWDQGFMGM
jgi:hypothetical protein